MRRYTLVTGSSSGIGKEIAKLLSKNGRNIIYHGSNDGKLCSLDASLNDLIWKFDLNDCFNLHSSLEKFLKSNNIVVDSFVHCAGVDCISPIKSLNITSNINIFNVNFFSAVEIVKTLISKKINNKELRSAVFISSNSSGFGARGMSMYVSSKSALDGFMKSAAMELAPNVRLNSVLPGAIRTEMTELTFQNIEISKKLLSAYPMGIGTPLQIAETVFFLLSDAANWINGQQIVVDGGRSMNISVS